MVPVIHLHRLLNIFPGRLLRSAVLVERSIRGLNLRLKFFFLEFVVRLFIELHEIGVDWQVLETDHHLGLLSEVVLLLLVGEIHA